MGNTGPVMPLNRRAVHAAFMGGLVVIFSVFASLSWSGYESAQQQALVAASNLTTTVSDNIEATISRIESDLRVFAPQLTPQDLAGHSDAARRADIEMRMGYHLRTFLAASTYRAFDRDGKSIFGAGRKSADVVIDVSGRDWFKSLKNTPGIEVVVSDLVLALDRQVPTFVVAIPVRDAQGHFLGALASAVDIEHLQAMIDNLRIGANGVVSIRNLAHTTILVRRPALADPIANAGQGAEIAAKIYAQGPAGTGDLVFPSDQIKRRYAYRTIPRYGLGVVVAVAADDYLAPWRHQTVWTGILVALLMAGLTALYMSQVKSQRDLNQFTAKLAQSEARFRSLVEGTTDWVWETDPHHRLTWVSDTIEEVFHHPAAYFMGRRREEIASVKHEADIAEWQHYVSTMNERRSFRDFRYWLDDGHGNPRWISVSGSPRMAEDGTFLGFRGSGTDVTHQFETAAQLRLLSSVVEHSPIAVVITSERSIIQYVNTQAARQSGYDPGELIGQNVTIFLSDENAPLTLAALRRSLLTATPWSGDIRSGHKSGRSTWEHVSVVFIRDDFGFIRHHVWLKEDISSRKQAEMQILSANRTLDAQAATLKSVNAELEQFAYVASHDLRQPLRMITSYLELIQAEVDGMLTDKTRSYFSHVTGGAKRMDRLILDLLEYSRTGRDMTVQPVSVSVAIEHAMQNLRVAIHDAQAAIRVADDLPDVMGGLTEVTRLFQNLVNNAIKYHAPGRPPAIEIGWAPEDDPSEPECWLFWVKDNGIGIEPQNFERVFMVFQRCVAADAYEGSGIGLAICKKIVDRLHGRIWLESVPGQGTTFFVCLPKAKGV